MEPIPKNENAQEAPGTTDRTRNLVMGEGDEALIHATFQDAREATRVASAICDRVKVLPIARLLAGAQRLTQLARGIEQGLLAKWNEIERANQPTAGETPKGK